MSKYSYQFKVRAVQDYFNKSHDYSLVYQKYGISSNHSLMAWVQDVQACGYESLAPKRSHRIYSLDYKLQVITYYRTHELSIDKVAAKFNLNRTQVYSWYRKYKNEGIVGLRSKPKGRPAKTMNKHKTINKYKIKPTKEEQYRQKIADLEAKIADQEMEIDILKKLQALRQQHGKNKH